MAHVIFVVTSGETVTLTAPPQPSLVMTLAVFGAGTLDAHETVTFPGHVITGGTLSKTVINCAQVALFPQASVAMYVLVRLNRLRHV